MRSNLCWGCNSQEKLQQACKKSVGGANRRAVSDPNRDELDKLSRTLVISGKNRRVTSAWVREMEFDGDQAVT
eukprot:2822905-Amphidinium_carterae.1